MKKALRVSQHAIEKYIREMKNCGSKIIESPQKEIMRLFKKAKKEPITPWIVLRIMNNGFKSAEYYMHETWRFVVCDNVMVTVEKNWFPHHKQKKKRKHRKRRRY